MLPDTHAHLDASELADDLDEVMARATLAGVAPILTVGTDLGSCRKAVEIAHRYEPVFAAVGIHPHQADRFAEEKDRVRALLDDEKVVAIGEIGLDYHHDRPARVDQLVAYREQLGWARERGLPVSIHNRDATDDVLAELSSTDRAVLHCFSGTAADAERGLALGCMISFAGNLTFLRADMLREAAAHVPLNQVLVESDAPVLAPQPRRGRCNEPAYVPMTAEALATAQGVAVDRLTEAVSANACRIFGWTAG